MVTFNKPRIFYFSLIGYTSWGRASIARGINTYEQPCLDEKDCSNSFVGGAVILCDYSDGNNCPTLVPGFNGIQYKIQNRVPGNIQLPIQKFDKTVVEGVPVFFRLFSSYYDDPKPTYIDIELSEKISIASWYSSTYTVEEIGSPENKDTRRYKVDISSFSSYALPIAFKFDKKIKYKKKYFIYFRIEGAGSWQKVTMRPDKIPKYKKLAKRFINSFTWSGLNYYETLDVYKSFQFNTIPGPSYCYYEPSWYYENYSPEKRREKYGDLMFCPENSLFYCTRSTKEACSVFTTLEMPVVDENCIPSWIQGSERTEERRLLQNAVDFYVKTGQRHRYNDLGYNGVVYRRQLEIFFDYLNATKPECINFDIEDWISLYKFRTEIVNSTNAQERRLSGESDEDLMYRIVDEMIQDIEAEFNKTVPDAKIIWFGMESISNTGYNLGKFEQFEKYLDVIPQPELYNNHKHPECVQNTIRGNRQGLKKGKHLIPMPTQGCWGEYSPRLVFDWIIHTYANGGTGIQLYPQRYVDDHADMLYLAEGIRIFTRYEDMVMDGEVAFHDIRDVKNLIVSAMKHRGRIIVSVSPNYNPMNTEKKGSFRIKFKYFAYECWDIRNDKRQRSSYDFGKKEIVVKFDKLDSNVLLIWDKMTQFYISLIVSLIVGLFFLCIFIFVIVNVLFFSFVNLFKTEQTK